MEAKTKHQKEVIALSKKLRPITEKQKEWAKDQAYKCFVISRNRSYCLECGHKWKDNIAMPQLGDCVCPHCNAKLKFNQDNSIKLDVDYVATLATKGGYQVVRMLCIKKLLKKSRKADVTVREVMQHWISPDGNIDTLTVGNASFGYCIDVWKYEEMEFRSLTESHYMRQNINPSKVYPSKAIIPILKRNGFKSRLYGYSPQDFFVTLLQGDSRFETLLKTKQTALLREYKTYNYSDSYSKYWRSILICIRNKYTVSDAGVWFDYLQLLEHYGKDIRNARYICPGNLNKEHDKLAAKRGKDMKKEKILEDVALNDRYQKSKSAFFGIQIQTGNISIAPLKSIEDFKKEAGALKHCVFTNGYYSNDNSLILSAKVDNKSTETIEIDLKELKVIQSRGLQNKSTEYHDTIVNLVNSNMPQVAKAKMNQLKTA